MPDGTVSGQPSPPPQPTKDDEGFAAPSLLGTGKTVAFVVVIQLFALFITHVNAPAIQASGYSYQPAGTSSGGSVTNVLILVVFVFASTLAAVWLARKRRAKVFFGIVLFGSGLALFLLTLLAAIQVTSSYFSAYDSLYISLACSLAAVALLVLVTLKKVPEWTALILTGVLSAEVGSYFASTIPILTALLLPIAFSLYDIYTVFKGPLRQLVTTLPAENLAAISSKIGDFSIGTGDTVFYAMIPALAYFQFAGVFGTAPALVSIVAVDVGVVVTLYLLGKVRLLPGLPIPMGLGLAVLLAYYVR